MRRPTLFRDMQTAPRDGITVIEVKHGPDQEIVRAMWSGQAQGWIREDDALRRTLHQVTGWRPVRRAPATRAFRPITTAPIGIAVEVVYGPSTAVALANWDGHRWILVDDPDGGALRRVTGWRPVE